MERILENYLTGLQTAIADDAGEHPEAVAVASVMVIDALGQTPEQRQITIQGKIYHSREVFERVGQALYVNGSQTMQQQFRGDDYLAELDAAPLTMLILARHLQRKMRQMQIGADADGAPVTLENAEVLPLPDHLNTADLRKFLQKFDQIEQQMADSIQAANNAGMRINK